MEIQKERFTLDDFKNIIKAVIDGETEVYKQRIK